jgi:hypothetical protein
MEQVIHAAQTLKLEIYDTSPDELKEIAKKLPSGRIYVQGRAFIPFIKRELYDKVYAASGGHVRDGTAPQPAVSRSEPTYPPTPTQFPPSWDDIAPGHIVLAPEGPKDGWWEAVVLSRDARTLTLRYRDAPSKAVLRLPFLHRMALADHAKSAMRARIRQLTAALGSLNFNFALRS